MTEQDSSLVAELEQATSELLDLTVAGSQQHPRNDRKTVKRPGAAHIDRLITPSPLHLSSPAPAYSSASKLVPIYSSDEEDGSSLRPRSHRKAPKPVKISSYGGRDEEVASESKTKAQISISGGALEDDDDWLPSGGLYSTIRSVHEDTSATPPPFLMRDSGGDSLGRSISASLIPPSKSPLKDAHGKLKDVWLNEYGERLVDGQVIGQLGAGRRRLDSPGMPSSASAPALKTNFDHTTKPQRSLDQQNPSNHGSSIGPAREVSTPAFFLQSFPNAIPGRRRSMDLSDPQRADLSGLNDHVIGAASSSPDATPDQSFATAASEPDVSSKAAARSKPASSKTASPFRKAKLLSPTLAVSHGPRPISPILLPSPSPEAPPAITQTQTKPVILHASKKRSQQSAVVSHEGLGMQGDRDTSRPTSSARPLERTPATPTEPMSLAQRAAALFTTPLVTSESLRPASPEFPGEEEALSRSFSVPSSPDLSWRAKLAQSRVGRGNRKDDGDDGSSLASVESLPSSLQSLPVSVLTVSSLTPSAISDSSSGTGNRRRSLSRGSSFRGSGSIFAREVRIRGWSEVGEKARGYVVFHVRVVTKQGLVILVHRRFSSFVALHKQLLAERPEYTRALPPLPPRATGLLHKYAPKHLETRRKGLQHWLEAVMLDARWAECSCLQEWIVDVG